MGRLSSDGQCAWITPGIPVNELACSNESSLRHSAAKLPEVYQKNMRGMPRWLDISAKEMGRV